MLSDFKQFLIDVFGIYLKNHVSSAENIDKIQ